MNHRNKPNRVHELWDSAFLQKNLMRDIYPYQELGRDITK